MWKIAPTYWVRLIAVVALLVLVWQQERWPLALLVTMMVISIETGHMRLRQMLRFIMTRANMPPITGGPHARAQATDKN